MPLAYVLTCMIMCLQTRVYHSRGVEASCDGSQVDRCYMTWVSPMLTDWCMCLATRMSVLHPELQAVESPGRDGRSVCVSCLQVVISHSSLTSLVETVIVTASACASMTGSKAHTPVLARS